MAAGQVLGEVIGSVLAGVGVAGLLGGVKWVKAVSRALDRLTDVAGQLADVTDAVETLRRRLERHEHTAEVRWVQLGGAVHPRYLSEDHRPPPIPTPAGAGE